MLKDRLERYFRPREVIDPSPPVADEVKTTTCYMCACRCGIRVHLKDGQIRYIDGNPKHPVNQGVICGKGAAGIMNHYSPARLTTPLRRKGPRGSGEFEEISWDEAMRLAVSWLGPIRSSDPKKLAFFTGRDQSQALTGLWAQSFGTPNFAAHGGFCSVNMAAAGLYSVGGSFWEFGEPDWERTKLFLLFGVAEDHESNPLKLGLSRLKARGAKIVSVNPVRTGYSAIADQWLPIRPGSDGLLVLALVHELLKAKAVDTDYLARYSDAGRLVVQAPETAQDGLYARDEAGHYLVLDQATNAVVPEGEAVAAMTGEAVLADGSRAVPVMELVARRYLDPAYAPEAVAERCGIPAATIRQLAGELVRAAFEEPVRVEVPWTDMNGERHDAFVGRGIAMHAMRGISAHSNGFHTCRTLHLLQLLLGSIDTPGGWRFKAPYPRPNPPAPPPGGRMGEVAPDTSLPRPPLGYPQGPEDLLVDGDGRPLRIDKAFSWDAPLAVHGMLQTVIRNAHDRDPYGIDVLFLYMANMAWNSAMNTAETMAMLSAKDPATGEYRIPRIIYADAYNSETVAFADLVLPDTTYLERWDCISLLDRPIGAAEGPGDAIRQPVMTPDRDVRPFQDVLIDLGARLGLPAFAADDGSPRYPGGYRDYIVNHERKPGIGPLAGWRGADGSEHGRGAPNPKQLEAYIANDCFWRFELEPEEQFLKHVNRAYLERAVALGLIEQAKPITLHLYMEPLQRFRLAARGQGAIRPPEDNRARIETYFDPLPLWSAPFEHTAASTADFPLRAVTQRPMPMYHAWGSHNAWLRQILTRNWLYMHHDTAADLGLVEEDWVTVTSAHGQVTAQLKLMAGCARDTVWTWNAIGKRAAAWGLAADAPESNKGFLMNHLIPELLPEEKGYRPANADPVTGQAAWYDLRVRVEKAPAGTKAVAPRFAPLPSRGKVRKVLAYAAGRSGR